MNRELTTGITRHLDLGCGRRPRNPYGRMELHGIDLGVGPAMTNVTLVEANLACAPIPYPDDHFDSVSAYDFLEHLPRIALDLAQSVTRTPFIELMNEVYRVLKKDGLFYASTPAYPHAAAFGDPTHVNFLTLETHIYFTRPKLFAQVYGFRGDFENLRVQRFDPDESHIYHPYDTSLWKRAMRRIRAELGMIPLGSHVLWEFRANKLIGPPPCPSLAELKEGLRRAR